MRFECFGCKYGRSWSRYLRNCCTMQEGTRAGVGHESKEAIVMIYTVDKNAAFEIINSSCRPISCIDVV